MYMYYSLKSLKGVIEEIIDCITMGLIKGDTRSFDYSSCRSLGVVSIVATPLEPCLRPRVISTVIAG